MIKEYALFISQVLLIVSVLALVISPFLFRSGGLIWGTITHKTILLISVCFGMFLIVTWIVVSINDPSQSLTAFVCLGGIAFIIGIYLVILYSRLPNIREKNIENQKCKRKDLPSDKDSKD